MQLRFVKVPLTLSVPYTLKCVLLACVYQCMVLRRWIFFSHSSMMVCSSFNSLTPIYCKLYCYYHGFVNVRYWNDLFILQFHDGVFFILLMGLLEGYYVPLHCYHMTPTTFDQKVRSFYLLGIYVWCQLWCFCFICLIFETVCVLACLVHTVHNVYVGRICTCLSWPMMLP